MVDPTEVLGSEHVVGLLSVAPWAISGEWLADLGMQAFMPKVGKAKVYTNLRVPLLRDLCAHPPSMRVVTTMDIGGWVLMEELAVVNTGCLWATFFAITLLRARIFRSCRVPLGRRRSWGALDSTGVGPWQLWRADMQPLINHLHRGLLFPPPPVYWGLLLLSHIRGHRDHPLGIRFSRRCSFWTRMSCGPLRSGMLHSALLRKRAYLPHVFACPTARHRTDRAAQQDGG